MRKLFVVCGLLFAGFMLMSAKPAKADTPSFDFCIGSICGGNTLPAPDWGMPNYGAPHPCHYHGNYSHCHYHYGYHRHGNYYRYYPPHHRHHNQHHHKHHNKKH